MVLYRNAVSNSHERKNEVCISIWYLPQKTLSSSLCQYTQDENATFQLREHDVAVVCAQQQLNDHNNVFSSNSILNWDWNLPLSWRPRRLQVAVHLGGQKTATCSRLRRHLIPIRASDKLQNRRSHAVRVSWALKSHRNKL